MNDKELHAKVNAAAYKLMRASGIVSPVEVLMEIGILSRADYERWRKGQLDYLERLCKINLRKLSKINKEIRAFAIRNNLKPSWTLYRKWGKRQRDVDGNTVKLRFSKSGDEKVERWYATHYITLRTVDEAKAKRETKKAAEHQGFSH